MNARKLSGPETVDEAIAILRDEDGLGALYALCMNADAQDVENMQIPRNIVTALVLCAMALWMREVEAIVVNNYQIKKLRQDGLYSVVSPDGKVVGDHMTHAQAWKLVDRLTNEPNSRSEHVVDWLFKQSIN